MDEINQLSTFSSKKEYKANETIFKHGQVSTHFYMLMEGLVYLQLPANPPEFNITISKVETGELFGISPLLNSEHYTSTARCHNDTSILSVEAKPFLDLLRLNGQAGLDIINQVANIYFTRYLNLINRLQEMVNQITLTN